MYGNNLYNPFNYQVFRPRGLSLFSKNTGKILSNLIHKFNFNDFLTGTSKTLNVINQAIPIYYQVKPMFNNAKTIFKIANAVKSNDNSNSNTIIKKEENKTIKNDNPVFYI